jgi:hypothetical protein
MRKRVFDSLEDRLASDLGTGRQGKLLYNALLSAVRDADIPGATEEFESRFSPLLTPGRSRRKVNPDPPAAVHSGNQSRVTGLCAAGAVACALALGFIIFNGLESETSTKTKPAVSRTIPEPAAKAPQQAAPRQVIREVQNP